MQFWEHLVKRSNINSRKKLKTFMEKEKRVKKVVRRSQKNSKKA